MSEEAIAVVGAFVAQAAARTEEVYVGIDPGAAGAIGLLCHRLAAAVDIPVTRVGVHRNKQLSEAEQKATGRKTRTVKGTAAEFDYRAVCDIFRALKPVRDRLVVALEKIPPKAGPGPLKMGDVKLFGAWAMWPLFLASRKYVVEEPSPAVWKRRLGLSGKDKEASRLRALKLFPHCKDILRKRDHNRAEALLIAHFTRSIRENSPADH